MAGHSSVAYASSQARLQGFRRSSQRWVFSTVVLGLLCMMALSRGSKGLGVVDVMGSEMKRQQSTHETPEGTEPIKPIRQISILGERNSGTRWTYSHLDECFGHALSVKKELTRYKHWFQHDDPDRYPHDTLVVAQFRNPYEWLKAMQHVPHHSPAHLRTALRETASNNKKKKKNKMSGDGTVVENENSANNDWKVFLTKPWTMERIGSDLWNNRTNHTVCQQHFLYRDIVSCDIEPLPHSAYNGRTIRYSEHQPFYELRNDGSGLPYDNILEMRSDKIRNFLSVIDMPGVADVWTVQYEFLVHKGTKHLVDRIAEWTGVQPKCEPKPPQNRKPKKSRRISPEFARHVRQHLNWTVEEMIGYHPLKELETPQRDWRS